MEAGSIQNILGMVWPELHAWAAEHAQPVSLLGFVWRIQLSDRGPTLHSLTTASGNDATAATGFGLAVNADVDKRRVWLLFEANVTVHLQVVPTDSHGVLVSLVQGARAASRALGRLRGRREATQDERQDVNATVNAEVVLALGLWPDRLPDLRIALVKPPNVSGLGDGLGPLVCALALRKSRRLGDWLVMDDGYHDFAVGVLGHYEHSKMENR